MKCELCGRQYIALGVHLRHKHGVDPKEYRDEFGILWTTPLVDDELSAQLSALATRRAQEPEYRLELQDRCRENAAAKKGRAAAGMSKAGKDALAVRNRNANDAYLHAKAPQVARELREKKTMLDVRKAFGTSPSAAKKMLRIDGGAYNAAAAKAERDKRAAATIRAKALARVAQIIHLLDTTKSAAEMCRLAGISIKTYKNWLSAGLIRRHPNGRGPRPK